MKHCLTIQRALILTTSLLATSIILADTNLFSADGYRINHYRSPTPLTSEYGRTLDTDALQQLLREQPNTRLIDVYRRQWLLGHFIEDEAHANLPNSLWLANTGDGDLDAQWQTYFQQHLVNASQGNRTWPMVFYCRSDCWLGWNAVKRAHHLGYTNLYWYRDGIDAWQQAGLPLIPAQPIPLPR